MGDFAKYILFEDIEELFDELDEAAILDPETKRPWRARDRWKELEAILKDQESKGVNPERLWINFSSVSKFGQYPRIKSSSKTTPVGIFGFPVKFALERKDSLPFGDRPYMHVFRLKKPHLEVGDQKTTSKKFSELKNKYYDYRNKINDDPVLREVETVRRQFRHEIDEDLRDPLMSIANSILSQLYDLPRGDGKQHMELLNNFDAKELVNSRYNYASILSNMKDYLSDLGFYNEKGDFIKRFQKVEDDLSAMPTPEYTEYMKKYAYNNFPSTLMSLDDIVRWHPDQFGSYGTHTESLRHLKTAKKIQESSKFSEVVAQLIAAFKDKIKQNIENPIPAPSFEDLPYATRLKQVADKYGLDFKQATLDSIDRAHHNRQFLYRAAEQLALQLQRKRSGGKWQMAWNTILRDIGVAGVADTKHTGRIHSSEPTQGVFLDPLNIVHVATIVSRSHSDRVDPSSKPPADQWQKFDKGSHNTMIGPTNQRAGILLQHTPDDKADWYYYGLSTRALNHSRMITNQFMLSPESLDRTIKSLVGLIKIAKTHSRLIAQGYQPKSNNILGPIKSHLDTAVKYVTHMFERDKANLNQEQRDTISKLVTTLDQLSKGETTQTPLFGRTLQKQPVAV
jgi:hypothetical protein